MVTLSRGGRFLSLGFSFASLVSAVTPGYSREREVASVVLGLGYLPPCSGVYQRPDEFRFGKGHSTPITQEEQEGFYSENLFRTRENRANKNQTAKDH